MKALIIEDNAAQAEFTRRGMARLGFECRAAHADPPDHDLGEFRQFANTGSSMFRFAARKLMPTKVTGRLSPLNWSA